MSKFRTPLFCAALILFFLIEAGADTIYLKNGRNIEGLIIREDEKMVELNVGNGKVVFRKSEIKDIYKSAPDEIVQINKKWEVSKSQADKLNWLAQEQRSKSWEEWSIKDAQNEAKRKIEEEEKRKVAANTKVVIISPDDEGGHLLVNVILNGKIPATLVIDTGSPTILLTAKIAEELGFDLAKIEKAGEIMVLNGMHKVGKVILSSIKLGEVEEYDVEADVLLEYDKEIEEASKDGLLGLSFLKRFHFALDEKDKKLILKKEN